MSVFALKITVLYFLRPKITVFPNFVWISTEILKATTDPLQNFRSQRRGATTIVLLLVLLCAFVHGMKYTLHPFWYRYKRKCNGPTKWPAIKGANMAAFPAPCKDSLSICRLGMITMMVSGNIKVILIFVMLVTLRYYFKMGILKRGD